MDVCDVRDYKEMSFISLDQMQLLMIDPEQSLTRVDKPLRDVMGWGKNHAAAYRCLVEEGSLEAKEVAVRTDIPQGRIYDVLEDLFQEGVVDKKGSKPAFYRAQHPQRTLSEQQKQYDEKVEKLTETLGSAYDLNDYSERNSAWVLGGQAGTIQKLRQIIDQAEESIYGIESDLRWLSVADINNIKDLSETIDVKLAIWSGRNREIDAFVEKGVPIWSYEDRSSTFYVIDERTVIIRLNDPDRGIVFDDSEFANMLTAKFEEFLNECEKIEP